MGKFESYTEKTTPVDDDVYLMGDSADLDAEGDFKTKRVKNKNVSGGGKGITFVLRGNASTGTKQTQILMPAAATIDKVIIYADTQPTGTSIIIDININGTTIFTTQSKRPEIAVSTNTDDSDTPDVTALLQDSRVSVDVDQVGSTIAGGDDLIVTVVFT